MPPQPYQAKVSEHTLLSPTYHWFAIDLINPHQLEFQAGQFIMLTVPGIPAKKAYSIPSTPDKKSQINLLIDVSPHGDGTRYLQSLAPGDDISFVAPAGLFVLADNPEEENYSFIATGSGISAIRSMIFHLLYEQKTTKPITLHWGMRYPEDLFWEDDFRMLENDFPNFHFNLVLSKAPEGWPMCKGHVTDCLVNHTQDFSKTGYYICGNQHMIDDVMKLLKDHGVTESCIHHERFT